MPYKIKIDEEKCIGCGTCLFCENLEINEKNKSQPKEEYVEEAGCNKEAAEICPVEAISLEEINYSEYKKILEEQESTSENS